MLSHRWSITNFDATKIIKSINTKHKGSDNIIGQTNALKYVLDTFNQIETNKNHHPINALLHLLYDWKQTEYIESIWDDIEKYHYYHGEINNLSYAILIKCLIKSQKSGIDKCIQALKWMEKYKYKLSIHGSLLNQLIIKCHKNNNDLESLKYIHSLIDNHSIEVNKSDIIVKTVLINAYGVCQSMNDAINIFNDISDNDKDNGCIGAMMKVYVNTENYTQAFEFYEQYKQTDNDVLHRLVLKACINTNDFSKGRVLHTNLKDNDNIYIKITLIDFYGHFKDIKMSEKIFESLNDKKNIFGINAMIKAYINNGYIDKALALFDQFIDIMDDVTLLLVIKACAHSNNYLKGQQIINHKRFIGNTNNMVLKAALIEFHGQFGDISSAWKIFRSIKRDKMDSYFLNAMLHALVTNGHYQQALQLYVNLEPLIDSISHTIAIKACIGTQNIEKGYEIIDKIIGDDNIQTKNILIEYYGHFKDIDKAFKVFTSLEKKDAISVSSMMGAYIKSEQFNQALDLYDKYYELNDDISHVLALKSCAYLKDFQTGRNIIQDNALKKSNNIQIKNSLISFYGESNDIDNALQIFQSIENKDIVTMNAMMGTYRDCELYHECIELFDGLKSYNLKPDLISFVIAIKSCTDATLLHHGQIIHKQLKRQENEWMLNDISIQTNLINMYGKCGNLNECENIFDNIKSKENDKYKNEIVIWNAMINAYGRNGKLSKVKQIYELLIEIGVIPNKKTYTLLINAYSHCGDIYQAQKIWNTEIDDDIKYDQYVMSALIDALSRKGLLNDAMSLLINNDCNWYSMWISLLNGCNKYNNLQLGKQVYDEIVLRFSDDQDVMVSAGVLIANLYASNGDHYQKSVILK